MFSVNRFIALLLSFSISFFSFSSSDLSIVCTSDSDLSPASDSDFAISFSDISFSRDAISTISPHYPFTDSELELLARVISAEARGECYTGQVAVGAVILNRVDHASFPDTIYDVCYERGAFTSVASGSADSPPTESCLSAARAALAGYDPTCGALFFYNPDHTDDEWIRSRPVVTVIGNHTFAV